MNPLNAELETVDRVCDMHGKFKAKVMLMLGSEIIANCPECSEEKNSKNIECEKTLEIENRFSRIASLFPESVIAKRFKNKSLENYVAENKESKLALAICKRYANNFNSRLQAGGGIVMCGKPGTGKTHLAVAILRKTQSENYTGVFISVMKALRRVKETYSKNSEKTENEVIGEFNQPDLLILDEVGVQFGSETEKMILFEIINERYQHMKPTILISNLALEELNGFIGERVIDRMREGGGAIIPFDWESYRVN